MPASEPRGELTDHGAVRPTSTCVYVGPFAIPSASAAARATSIAASTVAGGSSLGQTCASATPKAGRLGDDAIGGGTATDRVLADPPAFGVALAHVWPSELAPATVEAAIDVARAAAEALGIENGPTYTQVLVGPNGPVIGELAARLGGGHDAELCLAALDVDLNALTLAAALGDEIPRGRLVPDATVGGACIRFLVAREGELEAVEGVEDAAADDGVAWVRVYREPGAAIGPLRHGSDRVGAVLAVGTSRADAVARGERAAGRVRFRVADVHVPVES